MSSHVFSSCGLPDARLEVGGSTPSASVRHTLVPAASPGQRCGVWLWGTDKQCTAVVEAHATLRFITAPL